MRFVMNNIHTIFESAKSKNCAPSEHADKSGSKIDTTLGDSDLICLFDNICPICGDVFASMKDAAADPKNLKLTMVKTEDLGEATKIYIEAVEFATFCEAADLNIGEAAEEILDTCKGMVPGSNDSELHVVFPSEALNKGELGSTRFGRDVRNDWAMQLLTGCRRYGIHVNSGVEDGEPVTESAYKKAMNESFFGKKKKKESNPPEISYSDFSMLKAICAKELKKYPDVKKLAKFMPYSDLYDNSPGYDYFIELRIGSTIYVHGDHYDKLEELYKNCESFASDANKALKKEFDGNITISFDGGGDTLYFSFELGSGYVREAAEDVNDEEGIDEAAGSSNILKIDINGKSRSVYFRDKYKDPDERKKIESNVISDVKAIIKDEEKIKKKIYNFILNDEGHDGHADEDAKSNAGYLDYFEVVESGRGYAINATMDKYQYMITNLKNGKVTPSTEITYLD